MYPNEGYKLYNQIAGSLVKSIVNYAKEGKAVILGRKSNAGFSKFESRIVLFFPFEIKLNVTLNGTTKGREMIIE